MFYVSLKLIVQVYCLFQLALFSRLFLFICIQQNIDQISMYVFRVFTNSQRKFPNNLNYPDQHFSILEKLTITIVFPIIALLWVIFSTSGGYKIVLWFGNSTYFENIMHFYIINSALVFYKIFMASPLYSVVNWAFYFIRNVYENFRKVIYLINERLSLNNGRKLLLVSDSYFV